MAKQTNVLNERVYCYEHVKTKIIAHIPFGYARQYTNREKIGTGKFRRNCTFIDKKKHYKLEKSKNRNTNNGVPLIFTV